MKKYLIDPKLKWYKANLHCHTTNSDGHFSPEEIKKIYMDHGYSIVAYTDHEVIFDNSYLCDDNFIAITSTEYSINEPSSTGFRDMCVVHLNLFSKDMHVKFHPAASQETFWERQQKLYGEPIQCDGYKRVYSQESIQEVIDRANKAGFLVQFNHPNWSLNTRDDFMNLKGLWALEIYNHLSELETGAEYCPNYYNDMLRHGHRLFCTMNDDNHNGGKTLNESFGGFNMVGMESLSYDNVMKALEEGIFYCSMGPIIKSVAYDKEEMKVYVECSEVSSILCTGRNRRFFKVNGENLTKAEFQLDELDDQFRITIKDKYGKYANTHAYFIDEII